MKRRIAPTFWLAAALLILAGPLYLHAQGKNGSFPYVQGQDQGQGQSQAAQMVSAQAALTTTIDGKKMQPGTQFQAVLDQTIHLNNGTELPHGTRLIGTVTADNDTASQGASLSLRFTQAELKDGKMVPIRATITDLQSGQTATSVPGSNALAPWDGKSMVVEESGALPGVDLHSRIDSDNSGMFVATKKDDVKIAKGSEMELAIGMAG